MWESNNESFPPSVKQKMLEFFSRPNTAYYGNFLNTIFSAELYEKIFQDNTRYYVQYERVGGKVRFETVEAKGMGNTSFIVGIRNEPSRNVKKKKKSQKHNFPFLG